MAGIFGRMPPYSSNAMNFPPAGFEYFNPEPQQYGKFAVSVITDCLSMCTEQLILKTYTVSVFLKSAIRCFLNEYSVLRDTTVTVIVIFRCLVLRQLVAAFLGFSSEFWASLSFTPHYFKKPFMLTNEKEQQNQNGIWDLNTEYKEKQSLLFFLWMHWQPRGNEWNLDLNKAKFWSRVRHHTCKGLVCFFQKYFYTNPSFPKRSRFSPITPKTLARVNFIKENKEIKIRTNNCPVSAATSNVQCKHGGTWTRAARTVCSYNDCCPQHLLIEF